MFLLIWMGIDKPHICPTCNKGFSAKQALTQHMFIHSNEKPLVCGICHKAFRYPSALSESPLPPFYHVPATFLPPSYLLPASHLPPFYPFPTTFLPPSYPLPPPPYPLHPSLSHSLLTPAKQCTNASTQASNPSSAPSAGKASASRPTCPSTSARTRCAGGLRAPPRGVTGIFIGRIS